MPAARAPVPICWKLVGAAAAFEVVVAAAVAPELAAEEAEVPVAAAVLAAADEVEGDAAE